MPYTKHRDWFPIYLHDYQVTVSKIIPACLRSEDEGLIDDVYHALDLRSRLEEELNKHPKLERYRRSIKSESNIGNSGRIPNCIYRLE